MGCAPQDLLAQRLAADKHDKHLDLLGQGGQLALIQQGLRRRRRGDRETAIAERAVLWAWREVVSASLDHGVELLEK